MATGKLYGNVFLKAFNKEIDWDSDTIKVALVSSSYTPNQDSHDYWDDVSANEITGTGYTAGGKTLTNPTITYDAGTNVVKLDADDVSWTAATITARYAVIYDATPGSAATNPLIGYVDFGTDQSASAGTFALNWSSAGVATVTVS